MNEITTITEIITEKNELIDKNINAYLLLKLGNDRKVYVFPSKIKEDRWDQLIKDKYYSLTIDENENGLLRLLNFTPL